MNFDIRWAGQPHETLYNWINGGPGSPASTPQLEYWSKLKGSLADINTKLEDHLSRLGVSWEGVAADSAQRGLTPLKSWAERAQGAADVMNSSAQDQADYIATARANMPEPVKVSTPAPTAWQANQANAAAAGGNKGPAQAIAEQAADHEAQEQASSAASDRATQVMELYQKSSNGNASTLAVFEEPKGVIVAVNLPDGSNTADVVYSKGPGSPFVAETVGPGGVMTSEPGVGGPAGWTHGGGLDFAGSAGTASGGGESLAVGRGYGVVGEVADELLIGSFAGLGGPPTKGSTERGIDDAASGESAGDPVPIEEEPYAMSLSGGSITGSDDEERHGHSSSSEHERAQHSSVDSSSGQSNAQPDGQQDVQQSNAQPSNAQPNAQPTAQQHVQPAQPAQP
ncbi:MAG: PPE domain-containing protein, partial [Sciscionella sp.]|nr:PPE domain-containing protein [Sciscionella sp.]